MGHSVASFFDNAINKIIPDKTSRVLSFLAFQPGQLRPRRPATRYTSRFRQHRISRFCRLASPGILGLGSPPTNQSCCHINHLLSDSTESPCLHPRRSTPPYVSASITFLVITLFTSSGKLPSGYTRRSPFRRSTVLRAFTSSSSASMANAS